MFSEEFKKLFKETFKETCREVIEETLSEKLLEIVEKLGGANAGKTYLTQEETIKEFNTSRATLGRLRKRGELGYSRDFKGRIIYPRVEIEKYFARRTIYAAGDSGNIFTMSRKRRVV